METATRLAWGLLALVHLGPAATAFVPSLTERLYGLSPQGDVAILLAHRGVLFCGVVAACLFAMFDQPARRALSVVVAISVVGFLVLYMQAGAPPGALRTIAVADAAALLALAFVLFSAWRPGGAHP